MKKFTLRSEMKRPEATQRTYVCDRQFFILTQRHSLGGYVLECSGSRFRRLVGNLGKVKWALGVLGWDAAL